MSATEMSFALEQVHFHISVDPRDFFIKNLSRGAGSDMVMRLLRCACGRASKSINMRENRVITVKSNKIGSNDTTHRLSGIGSRGMRS